MKNAYLKMILSPLVLLLSLIPTSVSADSANEIITKTGVKGGLIVHLGCDDGTLTSSMLLNDRYLVHGLDSSQINIDKARKHIRSKNLYGKISVDFFDGKHLPYTDNLVNLVISNNPSDVPMKEILRVLAPGGVAYIQGKQTVKQRPDDIDEWTHFLHEPDNNAVAQDTQIGQPRSTQWIGGPRWGRSHEELASMSAAVSANGRLFYIMDVAPLASIRHESEWQLIARDAFNGIDLWKRSIPKWVNRLRSFRAGPAHLARRLVAMGDKLYITLGLDAPLAELDGATGKTIRTFEGTEYTEEILIDDNVLYLVIGSSEIDVTGRGLHREGEPEPADFRCIKALDIATGKCLWTENCSSEGSVLPLTLAVTKGKVLYYGSGGLVCLNSADGDELWRTERDTPEVRFAWSSPTLVVYDDVVLVADRNITANEAVSSGSIKWNVDGMGVKGIPRPAPSLLKAYSIQSGKELWDCPCKEGYNSPVDVFVVDDLVWYGPSFNQGRNVHTGKVAKSFSTKPEGVGMVHHRCYRNKATNRFILTGRSGVEFIDYDEGWLGNNSWVRGTCQYGILPCNGMLYIPPDACACFQRTKMQGMLALGSKVNPLKASARNTVLEKGPAFDFVSGSRTNGMEKSAPDAWPMYRRDRERSGYSPSKISKSLSPDWSTKIGGRLTQPVSSKGNVYVASIDTHTVYAVSGKDGKIIWDYTAGGRIDSSPTLYKDMVLFGSADGWVYCLRANDGQLAWRLRIAPDNRLISSFGQLESAWPVHGSVLVQNDKLYAAAGRVSYLDGGIYLYQVNPYQGTILSQKQIHHIDPATNTQTGKEVRGSFDMEGTLCDLLVGDGESVFMKHLRFVPSVNETTESKSHLFSTTGLLGEEWFVRSFWLVGEDISGGWGKWTNTKKMIARGRILSWNDERIFGYGREVYAPRQVGHRADSYHLFACPNILQKTPANIKGKNKFSQTQASSEAFHWQKNDPLMVRAMALTSDYLVVAGLPNVGKKSTSGLTYENPDDALSTFKGQKGALLRLYSSADGSLAEEYKLDSPPVFDGLITAQGCVYVSLRDGRLKCYKSENK